MRSLLLFAVMTLFACKKEQSADCQKLVQTAGPQHAALSEAFGNSSASPEDLEKQAASFEKGAADLGALDLKDETVKGIATDYASILTKAAQIRRDMATAAGGMDPAAAAKAQANATSFMVEETKVKARIDTTCR
jgi:hypothetical protein